MSSYPKSQNYFMKCFGFVLLFWFISLGAIGGCSNSGGQDGSRALTENDFAEDSSLSAIAGGGVVVHFLEPPGDGQTAQRDTGEVGMDVIPYRYNQTLEHTFCWEDDDPGAAHFMTLVDSSGEEVLMLEVNGDCVTEVIEKGNYEMRLHHDGLSGDTHPIFIQPVFDDQQTKNSPWEKRVIKTVKSIFEETLLLIGISTEARAQTVAQNVQTLLKTLSCDNCDLKNANLANAVLTKAQLTGTNLAGAVLTGANLAGARIVQANMSEAEIFGTDLSMVNLSMANLSMTNLLSCNLNGANLFGADLTMGALENSSLVGANLNEANLSGVTWCNPDCVCGANSIGTCNGCPSQDTCKVVKDG